MRRADIGDIELAYDEAGEGEPLLLIHSFFVAEAMRPLMDEAWFKRFRRIMYHRRGYGESGGGLTADVREHAADAVALLERLGAPAHLVGHSFGSAVALEVAASRPDIVRSVSLLEPALIAQLPSTDRISALVGPVIDPLMAGDPETATRRFLEITCGPEYEEIVNESIGPQAVKHAIDNAQNALRGDFPALLRWPFGRDRAATIACPVLLVLGSKTRDTIRHGAAALGIDIGDIDLFGEMVELAYEWLPGAEAEVLPGMNHAMQLDDAGRVARAIAWFISRHTS